MSPVESGRDQRNFAQLALSRVQFCALRGLSGELGFAELFARKLSGFARLWVEHFFLFGGLLWLFRRCHV